MKKTNLKTLKKISPEENRSKFQLIINQEYIDELAAEEKAEQQLFQKKREIRLKKEKKEQDKQEKKMMQRELERQNIIKNYTPEQIKAVNDRRASFFIISNEEFKSKKFQVVE